LVCGHTLSDRHCDPNASIPRDAETWLPAVGRVPCRRSIALQNAHVECQRRPVELPARFHVCEPARIGDLGRTRLAGWIDSTPSDDAERFVLSLDDSARSLHELHDGTTARRLRGACVLSGPEGGLSAAEERDAIARGFAPLTLGPRVLRAETAALAALALLAQQ